MHEAGNNGGRTSHTPFWAVRQGAAGATCRALPAARGVTEAVHQIAVATSPGLQRSYAWDSSYTLSEENDSTENNGL